MPIVEYLEGGWAHVHWNLFGFVIWEGLLPPESIACIRCICITVPMIAALWAYHKWENWRDDPRHK